MNIRWGADSFAFSAALTPETAKAQNSASKRQRIYLTFYLVSMRLIAVFPPACRRQAVSGFDGFEMMPQVVGQLVEDDLPLFGFVLTPRRFPMEHGFSISDER